MGSTSEHREAGQSDRQFWQNQFDSAHYRIVDCATVGRNVFYAAVEVLKGPEAGTVTAFVALQQWSGGYFNFTHKTMTESAGPCAAECPARILDLLTELPECEHFGPQREYFYCGTCSAREWRAECRKLADRRARAARVKPGQVVKFARPIAFRSGDELDTLVFARRDSFTAGGRAYRVTGWRTREWELVPA